MTTRESPVLKRTTTYTLPPPRTAQSNTHRHSVNQTLHTPRTSKLISFATPNLPTFPKLCLTTPKPAISTQAPDSDDEFLICPKKRTISSKKRKNSATTTDSEDEFILPFTQPNPTISTKTKFAKPSRRTVDTKKQKLSHTPLASKPCPKPSELQIPPIFTSPPPKNTHKAISTDEFFAQYTLQGKIFDLEYKKFTKKIGYSRKAKKQPNVTPFLEKHSGARAARQQAQRSIMSIPKHKAYSSNKRHVTTISCLADLVNPTEYISQARFKPQNIFGVLHMLTHLQDLYLTTLNTADYQLFQRLYIERQITRPQMTVNSSLGNFQISTDGCEAIQTMVQTLGNNHGLQHAKDFSLFFKMTNNLHITFKNIALSLLNFCPQSVQHSPYLSTAWHDNFALAPSSQRQYRSTLNQFAIFLLQSDGPRAIELTLEFLNTHEYANHLIGNFLLLRTLPPFSLQFTTVRNKMIYLSYFQRYRSDQQRFTKVDYWIKFFFNRSLGRLFCNNTTGAPPFTRQQLLNLFTAIQDSNSADFPTKHRDLYVFKYSASLAFRTQEMTDLIWFLTDFNDDYLIQGIDNAKNDKIHSTGQFLYYQKTNTPNCPVYLINKLYDLRDKNSHFICTQSSGKPHNNASLNKLLRRYLTLFLPVAQAKRFSFYSFRTSYVAIMSTAQEGDNLAEIQKVLRQKVIQSTDIYHRKRFSRPATSKGNFLETVKSKLPQTEIIDPSIFEKFFTNVDQDSLLQQYQLEHKSQL